MRIAEPPAPPEREIARDRGALTVGAALSRRHGTSVPIGVPICDPGMTAKNVLVAQRAG